MTGSVARSHTSAGAVSLREAHRRILQLLVDTPGGMRQEELMDATKLARSSVSGLLSELSDVVEDTSQPHHLAGRPPRVHRIKSQLGIVAGIDVGFLRVHVTLHDLEGTLLPGAFPREQRIAQDGSRGSAKRTLALAAGLIREELARPERGGAPLVAIGVSLPGTVARGAVTTSDAALPDWHDVDVPDLLTRELHATVPVVLEHEANAAMLAERRWGLARTVEDAMFVEWSATISASLLIDGRIRRGHTGTAGEIGHLQLPLDGGARRALGVTGSADIAHRPCPHCGKVMCVQQLAGGIRMGEVLNVSSIGQGALLVDHDPKALARARAMAHLLGRAIGVGIAVVDPAVVIVGGGAPPHLLQIGIDEIERGARETAAPREPRIKLSELGSSAAIRGAAAAAVDRQTVAFLLRALG